MADFNALTNMEDRNRAILRYGEIALMLEWLNHCRLFDVKTTGKALYMKQ